MNTGQSQAYSRSECTQEEISIKPAGKEENNIDIGSCRCSELDTNKQHETIQ